nr:hypothetical protein [Tanacetum cinerariifolium]
MKEAQQLKLVTKRSMQQMHISLASGSSADEGIGSIPGVLDAPTDESEEELFLNYTNDEGDADEGKNGDNDKEDEGDDGEEGDGDDDDEEDDDGEEVAMDEAFVPHTQRLRIGRSNFRLLSDIKSKESTLQLVYDVLRICPFFKAFLMDNKKHIINLESFRDMLHMCPRVHGQSFDEPPFEEEILAFIRFLGHSAAIRTLTDVNINKLYQPWRSFAAIINKCLTGKSSGYDSLKLSQAQILRGLYHKRNIDYAYLLWEDLVYQVEHKNTKKSKEMYYLWFTKVIIHHFMSKDPSIFRRNKVNWHYVRDDHMFSTIKLVSRHQNMQ